MLKSMKKVVIVFACISAMSFSYMNVNIDAELLKSNLRIMPVTSTATINVKPDIANVSMQVYIENEDQNKTLEENTRKSDAVIKGIKRLGFSDDEIITNLQTYSYDKIISTKVTGNSYKNETKKYYAARTTIGIKTTKLDKIKDLVSTSLTNGVTNIDSIYYDVQNKEKYYLELKKEALKKAKEDGDYILAGAGSKTGKLMAFEFDSYNVMMAPQPAMMREEKQMDVAAAPVITPVNIIPPKEIPITQSVQAIFEIK